MHYYLYEVRNNISGKIYIGVHKTKNMSDGYMGSGALIRRAIEKYGVENFTKTILDTFESQDEMFNAERELVTEEFLARDDVYNLRLGGEGGYDFIHKNNLHHGFTGMRHSDKTRRSISESLTGVPRSESHRESLKENNWARRDPVKQKEHARRNGILTNSLRTKETIQSISDSVKEHWKSIECVKCPHCDVVGRGGAMKRYHFNKCKKAVLAQ